MEREFFDHLTETDMKKQLDNILKAAKEKHYPDKKATVYKTDKAVTLNKVAWALDDLAGLLGVV